MTDNYEVPPEQVHGHVYPKLANAIRLARQDALMDRGELSLRCGVSERTIERWEKGKSSPTRRKLMLIAQVTGKPMEYFPQDDIPLMGVAKSQAKREQEARDAQEE